MGKQNVKNYFFCKTNALTLLNLYLLTPIGVLNNMNISFGEILVIGLIALLFYKPDDVRAFISSVFKMKKDIEDDVHAMIHENKEKIEFFEEKE